MSVIEPHTEKLKYIFDNAKVGIAICNAEDNTLEMVNPAFAAIHGYEPHELIGVFPGDVFAPECMLRLSEYESTSACAIEDVAFETVHTKKDGSLVPVSVHITVIKDENGIIKQRIANVIDISKRKQAESKLRITHERFNQIYDNSIDVMYLIEVTPEGRFVHLDINSAFVKVTGMEREKIIGRYVDTFENEAFQNIFLDKYSTCLQAGRKTDYINDYPFPAGIKTFHSVLTPLFDESGRIYQIVGIARDITEQKRIESVLASRENEFRSLAENTPDNIARWDCEGRYLYINPVHEQILGKSLAEVIGTFIPDSHKMVKDAIRQVAATGEKIMVQQSALNDKGEIEVHDVKIVPERDSSGKIVTILGIGRDITERKEIEKQLLEQNRFLESLLNAIPVPIFLKDKESRYKGFNKAFEEFYGKNKADLIGKGVYDLFPQEQAQVFFDADADLFRHGGTQIYETQLQDARGIDHTVMFHKAIYFDEAGEAIGQIGSILDITERKQQEEQLHKTKAKLSAVIFTIPDLIWVKDAEGVYMMCNLPFANFFSVSEDEIIGKTDYDFFESDAADICKQSDIEAITANTLTLSYETFIDPSSGEESVWEIRKIPVYNAENFMGVLGIGRDITEQKKMELEIAKQKDFQNTLLLSIAEAGLGVHVIEEGRYIYTNDMQKAKKYGYDETIFEVKPNFIDTIHPDDRAKAIEMYTRRLRGEDVPSTYELGVVDKDGARKEHSVSVIVIPNTDPLQTIVVTQDITERKRMEEMMTQKESRLKEAQKIAKVGSWELEFPGLKLTWSDEIYRIFELDPNLFEPSYDYFLNLIHPEDREYIDTAFATSLKSKTPYDVVHRLLMSNGEIKYVHERGETFYNEEGNPIRSVGTVQDITKQKVIEKKIEHMAHHDALTGLPNRTLAKARAEQIIAHAKRSKSKVAFLFIDLDGFKTINDTLGHSAGDSMLKTIALRLKECVRESDIISRQGGDEFLLILSDIKEENVIASTTQKVLSELEKSFEIHDHTLSISGSIGISLYPDHGDNFELLLKSADTAMYKAKETGKNGYHFYTHQMTHNIIGQFKIQNDLKMALENNEFTLFYQPQIDLATNRITGVEALIRWFHPQLGMIPPMSFIPIAESSGLIVSIGQWVIEEACTQAALWQKIEIDISVAVNISAMQFKRGNLEEIVKNALLSSQINPNRLELELTESIIMHDADNTLQSVRNLKALGVQLSIDDFGTGYSSLSYLKQFAVDKLKIDQSFVRDILQDQEDAVIVQTIIQMAKNLNLKTIAEGVEDAQVLSAIEAFGCDEVQGYHFAKPMPATELEYYYANFNKISPVCEK
jgi:diguanylate cyclase (GGDEF)-like protein/PAS domain S-box-containing protein